MRKRQIQIGVMVVVLVGAMATMRGGSALIGNLASVDTVIRSSTLTVQMAGTGSGTVRLTSTGVAAPGSRTGPVTLQKDCETSCRVSYTSGAIVNLAAVPAAGSVFSGWDVSDRVGRLLCGGTGGCTVAMVDDVVAAARFERLYTLKLELRGIQPYFLGGVVDSADGKIHCRVPPTTTSVCSATYLPGTIVALHAEPDKDGHSYWAGYWDDCTSETKDCSLVMDSDKIVGMRWGGGMCGADESGLKSKDCGGGLTDPAF